MTMTRQDVVSVLGLVDNATIAEIIASGATLEELREAWAWAFGDEALMSQGRPLPGNTGGNANRPDRARRRSRPGGSGPRGLGRRLLNGEDAVYDFPFRQAHSFVRSAW